MILSNPDASPTSSTRTHQRHFQTTRTHQKNPAQLVPTKDHPSNSFMSGNSSQKPEIKDFIKNQKNSKKNQIKKSNNKKNKLKNQKKSKKNQKRIKKNQILGCFLKILKIAKNPGFDSFLFFLIIF